MHSNLIMNSIGWVFIIFLEISKLLYSKQLFTYNYWIRRITMFYDSLYLAFFRTFRKK